MPKKKDNFLEKMVKKNYNDQLEEVLETKDFEENAKNLLLEILYKVEVTYKDYEMVKREVESKETYIEKIIHVIQEKCEIIDIIKPQREEENKLKGRTFSVDKEKKEILCLPIERKLLYAIAKMDKPEQIIKENYFLIHQTLSNTIMVGNNINMVEPLRDFNGWSWTTMTREMESIEYNLIYQNLRMLIGTEFLESWIANREYIIDYMELFQNEMENLYGKEKSQKFLDILYPLSVLMEIKVKETAKDEMIEMKQQLEKELEQLKDKKQFTIDITKQKKELTDQIKQIDTVINDKEQLQEEYRRRNSELNPENKIFSMRILAEMMIREREKVFQKLEDCNELLNPKKYLEKKSEVEERLKYLSFLEGEDLEEERMEQLVQLQKAFLNCLDEKIQIAETKNQMINLIYQFRYFCMIPFSDRETIYDVRALRKVVEETEKELIKKAIQLKIIIPFSKEEEWNYEIIRNIFRIRVICLEELHVKMTKEKDQYFLQLFDENIFEEKIKLQLKKQMNKKDLEVRIGKKIKLFM